MSKSEFFADKRNNGEFNIFFQKPYKKKRNAQNNLLRNKRQALKSTGNKSIIIKDENKGSAVVVLDKTYSYLPTPPLEQNMTQGQFLSGVYQV